MRLSPSARVRPVALQLTSFNVPSFTATPLPPRSLTQVTLASLRSSAATPEMFSEPTRLLNEPEVVGPVIVSVGIAPSARAAYASASSSTAALGSSGSAMLLPPQAANVAQIAATAASLARGLRSFFIFQSLQ